MLRLGIGIAATVVVALLLWGSFEAYVKRERDAAYREGVLDTKAALEADSADKVANAADAVKNLPPTPTNKVELIALCNSDEDCRERGQQ